MPTESPLRSLTERGFIFFVCHLDGVTPAYAGLFVEEFRPASAVEADTDLAVALRIGDEAAVRELYDRFGGLVFTVALRILGDRGHADEATQQTFLQAWRNSDRFEAGRDFAPWLATIARRAAIDIQRRERRRPAGSLEHADAADSSLVALPPDAEQIETTWVVRRAIENLDADERDVVKLQHVEGCSHSEIAERLGVAVGTVKSRSFRAHRRLATRLAYLRDDDSGGPLDGEKASS